MTAITRRKILDSIKIILSSGHVEVCWKNQLIEDGIVISEKDHNGAYPLKENGELDEDISSEIGVTIADVIGEASDNLQRLLIQTTTDLNNKTNIIASRDQEIAILKNRIESMSMLSPQE